MYLSAPCMRVTPRIREIFFKKHAGLMPVLLPLRTKASKYDDDDDDTR